MDGNRSSSAQAAFKVPKVPKKPTESSAARRPSATGGKLGTSSRAVHTEVFLIQGMNLMEYFMQVDKRFVTKQMNQFFDPVTFFLVNKSLFLGP